MDVLTKIYGKDSSMQTLAMELKDHADVLTALESDLARLLDLQGEDPERRLQMEGRIYVGGDPMLVSAEIPIAELIKSKRDELERILGAVNRVCVRINEASIQLDKHMGKAAQTEKPAPPPAAKKITDEKVAAPMPRAIAGDVMNSDEALNFGPGTQSAYHFGPPLVGGFRRG